jgi:shikimate kinase
MARQVRPNNSCKPKPLRDGLIQALGRQVIRLVGPGGAGKTTAGVALARRLDIPFVDLDRQFAGRYGNISHFLETHGYQAYAAGNIQVYLDTLASCPEEAVFALSSGFMTYGNDAHPAYLDIIQDIAGSRSTVVLLPAFELELCVAETVRRQLQRPFCRPVEREEQVIRSRFGVYWRMPVMKCETMRPVDVIVDDLVKYLLPDIRLQPSAAGAMMSRHG